jgi:hypothetical protein
MQKSNDLHGAKLNQTVRKLQDLGIEWREERAGRNFSRFRPIGRLMRPERVSMALSRARRSRTASGRDGGGHRLDAEDVEGAAQIVGERRQAELGAHVGEAAHQEGALIHPLLDTAARACASRRRHRVT